MHLSQCLKLNWQIIDGNSFKNENKSQIKIRIPKNFRKRILHDTVEWYFYYHCYLCHWHGEKSSKNWKLIHS